MQRYRRSGKRTKGQGSDTRRVLREGDLDRCGIALLAGKTGGCAVRRGVVACLVLSEILRLLHGGECTKLLILTSRA